MQYIINSTIIFESGDGTLRHRGTDDVVQLPLPAQRLLQLLLESECEILSRDFLFREVWDKYGLTGSNSNLNQYLSLLRRSMSVYGCETFVITIPKVGIKLDEHVSIIETTHKKTSI
ncbi:TPA: winged helix-turn-helix domain-containing protein [Enterobacter kobei]|nr:winged helix-turn-helix domain-containing protein [Enterobacter kobei]